MTKEIFTVGHSTHPIDRFINLLVRNQIEVVADVRSSPFSKFNPQFNRDELKTSLKNAGIRYVFLGKELGARSDDPACYVAGKVQYQCLAKTALFQAGVDRAIEGSDKFRVALMCAEKDPLECHRTILVARELINKGVAVTHILESGALEPHDESLKRLIKNLGMSSNDMFRSQQEVVADAYTLQAELIAYDKGERDSTISRRAKRGGAEKAS